MTNHWKFIQIEIIKIIAETTHRGIEIETWNYMCNQMMKLKNIIEENKRAFSNKILNQIESKKYRQRFNWERIMQIKVDLMINKVDAYHHWETSAWDLNRKQLRP